MEVAHQTIDGKTVKCIFFFFVNLAAPGFSCQNYRNITRFAISYFNSLICSVNYHQMKNNVVN